MIQELLSEWGAHLRERLRNPILGPFSAIWLAWNWQLVAVLFHSRTEIEHRIHYIDENFIKLWDIFLIPVAIATAYALIVPWISLAVQNFQDGANTRRRKNRLKHETQVLQASVERAEAQAALNKILAQDEITRRQQEEIAAMKDELAAQKQDAESRVKAAQEEFEQKRREYEASADKRTAEAKKMKDDLFRLEKMLDAEKAQAQNEFDKMRKDISQKERSLDLNLQTKSASAPIVPKNKLIKLIVSKKYRLFHNPGVGPERSKVMTFSTSGDIKAGANNNEHKWRIHNGLLELLQKDGEVHSRFRYLPDSKIFLHTGDYDTKSAAGQFLIPEPSSRDDTEQIAAADV